MSSEARCRTNHESVPCSAGVVGSTVTVIGAP
jgi:hypothetical protein